MSNNLIRIRSLDYPMATLNIQKSPQHDLTICDQSEHM